MDGNLSMSNNFVYASEHDCERKEEWKAIVGYVGYYEVSSHGRARSLDRVISKLDGRIQKSKGAIKKQSLNKQGYYYVGLSKSGKGSIKKIHQLVAESFLGHKRCGFKLVVDHIDSNPLNNHASNLQVITQRKNVAKKISKTSSNYIGVSWNKQLQKWKADIYINKEPHYLGYFKNEIDAHNAYQDKLKSIL